MISRQPVVVLRVCAGVLARTLYDATVDFLFLVRPGVRTEDGSGREDLLRFVERVSKRVAERRLCVRRREARTQRRATQNVIRQLFLFAKAESCRCWRDLTLYFLLLMLLEML